MGMITDAVVLAFATAGAGYMVYRKAGPKVKKFIISHPLLSEAGSTILAYLVMGGGVTAIMGSAFCCLIISGMLYIASNPEDFVWLDDALNRCKGSLEDLKNMIKEKNAEYLAAKA